MAVKTANDYFDKNLQYSKELNELRRILLKSGLTETIKWGIPCYCYQKHNVVALCEFKSYFGLWFYQGALLKDEAKVLINANEENTKALRQWRMNSMDDIDEKSILSYIHESIENFKIGNIILPERGKEINVPNELQDVLNTKNDVKIQFESLSTTKKRDFCEFISSAKRVETKQQRIEKIIPMIMNGIGLYDQYKK